MYGYPPRRSRRAILVSVAFPKWLGFLPVHPLLALAVLLIVTLAGFAGLSWSIVFAASIMLLAFFVFFAPADCRAANRNGSLCRNNAHGLMGACHLQQHKRQKAWRNLLRLGPQGWLRENMEGLFGTARQSIDTLGAVGSVVSALIALVGVVLTR